FNALGLTVDRAGNLYLSGALEIRKVTPAGQTDTLFSINRVGVPDTVPPPLPPMPVVEAVDGAGNSIVVEDGRVIRKMSSTGVMSDPIQTASSNERISGVALDASGNLFVNVIRRPYGLIRKVTPSGVATTALDLSRLGVTASSVAVDASGNIYFATSRSVCK